MTPNTHKRRLLTLTSTFPRFDHDTNPPFVYDLCQRLSKTMEVSVLTPHSPGSKVDEQMGRVRVHRFRYFIEKFEKLAGNGGILPTLKANKWYYLTVPFFMLAEIFSTLKLVRKIKPDLIHAHWILPQGLCALINYWVNKTPYIITSHGSDLHSLGLGWIKTIILRKAKHITVVSKYLQNKIEDLGPQLLLNTSVIPMGVDTSLFNPNRYSKELKDLYGSEGPLLLYVGRLVPEKGVKYLILAMPTALVIYPNAKLLIIGEGEEESKLKELVDQLNLAQKVIFLGAMEHDLLPKYYATADVCIVPSLKEGLGLTIIEAGLCGSKVIGSKLPGTELILEPVNTFEPQNIESLSQKLIETIAKPTPRKVNKIYEAYSLTDITKKYEEILK